MKASAPNRSERQAAARGALRARARLVEDLERLCADAGVPLETLATAAGVPGSYLRRIMAGKAHPSLETYSKLAAPLGADLATRIYPNTGPTVRDRHQARIVEAFLQILHPRWKPATEVAVRQPARGWIDVVLHEPREALVAAVEIESDIRRLEQQLRWARMKADSLPSSDAWPRHGDPPRTSQLLIVRRTRATRQTALEFARQLALAYPAHPEDALAALTGTAAWPGSAMLWAQINLDRVRFVPSR
ncbi:MAG: helix-turn-helix transcriptional regulator [Chloroflexi bacterium]|nr:helix-turn-helix transcriptional regulator [Chloroflexota bacterium]